MNINLPILGKFYNVYQSLTNMVFCAKYTLNQRNLFDIR